jgi:26S proteasome regulatory subunit T1
MTRLLQCFLNDIFISSHPSGEQPLQVARCTKIINADTDDPKYIINVKQFAKFVVELSDQVAPTDIEEGMRVG